MGEAIREKRHHLGRLSDPHCDNMSHRTMRERSGFRYAGCASLRLKLTAIGPPHGMGRHVIFVSKNDQRLVRLGDYIFSHFYDFALVFVKLGILAFYYRVFVHPVFRKAVLATAAFVIAWGIGITVTLFLACRPLRAYWDVDVPGKCLVMVTFTYFTNISNLITDIWIFLMPVPMIWHLQLQVKKKMILSLIFCIGLA